jgi:hypothetical protein
VTTKIARQTLSQNLFQMAYSQMVLFKITNAFITELAFSKTFFKGFPLLSFHAIRSKCTLELDLTNWY